MARAFQRTAEGPPRGQCGPLPRAVVPATRGRDRTLLAAAIVLGAIAIGCSGPPAGPTGPPTADQAMPLAHQLDTAGKNIVLVLSDTHRADYVSPGYPGEDRITPNLRLLAMDGVRFTQAYTLIPISAPSYATLLSGKKPLEHGLLNNHQSLDPSIPLLQEYLRDAGYQSAGISSNYYCSSKFGFDRGFDYFWDNISEQGKMGQHVTDAALFWLRERREDQPFFLFVAYMDAHTPYLSDGIPPSLLVLVNDRPCCVLKAENAHVEHRIPVTIEPGRNTLEWSYLKDLKVAVPPDAASPLYITGLHLLDQELEYRRESGFTAVEDTRFHQLSYRSVLVIENPTGQAVATEVRFRCFRRYEHHEHAPFYLDGVRSFDRHFGRLIGYLEKHGLYDDAVVIFVSDHGEMLGEHGAWGHLDALYEEDLRIPLIIKAPGIRPGTVYRSYFDLQELYQLILTLAGIARQEDDARFPFVTAGPRTARVAATFPPEAEQRLIAVRRGDYKLISDGAERVELYDLKTDPGEQTNLYHEPRFAGTVREMLAIARQQLLHPDGSLERLHLTEQDIEQLQALGYLD